MDYRTKDFNRFFIMDCWIM
uniref:Uncharacterized protein n=1 Tax=Wuchereria bancrofti TaxID=6293 RepID=A0A1I8EBA2_WUCBA